jgi:TPR repeat protein
MRQLFTRRPTLLAAALAMVAAAGCSRSASRSTAVTTVPPPPAVCADIEACRADKLDRCVEVAHVLDNPEADLSLRAKLAREFIPGCDHQVPEDCFRAGVFAETPDLMLSRFELACTGRVGIACRMLGDMLSQHEGSAELLTQSVALYQKGCDVRDAASCVSLARIYQHGGAGVNRDVAQAESLYGRACGQLRDETACRAGAALACGEGHLDDCGTTVVPVAETIAR